MDGFILRCNVIRCRAQLENRAVVTTCSHVFCESCAENVGLLALTHGHGNIINPGTANSNQHKTCPACKTNLSSPDDAVLTLLNPSDEYKTSVLSGISPGVIMEIAARGIAFWNYQASQEIVYQETFARNLNEKYSALNLQLDKLIHDANTEISNVRSRMENLALEREGLEKKCLELADAYREKSKKCLQIQDLYDKLKRKMLMSDVQHAATETVENMTMGGIHSVMSGQQEYDNGQNSSRNRERYGVIDNPVMVGDMTGAGLNIQGLRIGVPGVNRNVAGGGITGGMRGVLSGRENQTAPRGSGPYNNGIFIDIDPRSTPCTTPARGGMPTNVHRQYAPTPGNQRQHFSNNHANENFFTQAPNAPSVYNSRQPLNGLNGNIMGSKTGGHIGGLSAGVRVGRQNLASGNGNGHGDGGLGVNARGGKVF